MVRQIPDAVGTVVCAPDDGWKYHPKHVGKFPDINKLCNIASCWIYIGVLLGAHPILHISRIRVNNQHLEQSPGEATSFSAIEEIPCILWNLKVCYHVTAAFPLSLS
jgi:hypothetical protein